MKPCPWLHIENFRVDGEPGTPEGAFHVPHLQTNTMLRIIASSGAWQFPWEHVSVSTKNRTPNWREMEFACRLFWTDEETVMQLHPPRSQWVNNHPYVLHLWKPITQTIPTPPMSMV